MENIKTMKEALKQFIGWAVIASISAWLFPRQAETIFSVFFFYIAFVSLKAFFEMCHFKKMSELLDATAGMIMIGALLIWLFPNYSEEIVLVISIIWGLSLIGAFIDPDKKKIYSLIDSDYYVYLNDIYVKSGIKSKEKFNKMINSLVEENKVIVSCDDFIATKDVASNIKKQYLELIENSFSMGDGLLSMKQIISSAKMKNMTDTQLKIAGILIDDLIKKDESIEVIDMPEVTLYKKIGMIENTRYLELELD